MMVIELKWSAICIGNHTTFLVQCGGNLHKWVFQKVSKLLEPVEQMKFGLFVSDQTVLSLVASNIA